jgi:hypothetical protein
MHVEFFLNETHNNQTGKQLASSYSRVKRCTIPLGGDIHNEKNLALVYAQVNIIPFDIL